MRHLLCLVKMLIDKSTCAGLVIALSGIGLGLALEGGKVSQILQPTAGLIVFGGTIGAVMVQFPMRTVLDALKQLKNVFFSSAPESDTLVQNLLQYAFKARHDGLVSLDGELEKIQDPFLKASLTLAVDGMDAADLKKMTELQLDYQAEKSEEAIRVFEAAAGYSPTIGIIGAVLGLIQVMQQLQNVSQIGRGIAIAFVATIYGVGFANLFLLPAAGKLKIRLREREVIQEMMLEAVLCIIDKMNPRTLEMRLGSYLPSTPQREVAKTPVMQ